MHEIQYLSVGDAAAELRERYHADVTARDLSVGLYNGRFKVDIVRSSAGHLIPAAELPKIAAVLRRAGRIPADVQVIA